MQCGISTSCFYPMDTLQALKTLQAAGILQGEIFLNTFSELEQPYLSRLIPCVQAGALHVEALHPFSSGLETFFFASAYAQRIEDGLALYQKFFVLAQTIGAHKLVFHGDHKQTPFPFRQHCENFARLQQLGRRYGVEVCQENVVRNKCGRPEYIRKMREYLKDDVSFVLDVKQVRRAGVPMQEMLGAMSGKIAHVHLSDETPTCDCALPGSGTFDFAGLFRALKAQGFDGSMLIELYRGDFKDIDALVGACNYLNAAYAAAKP